MFGNRLKLALTLETLAPLHIGSGHRATDADLASDEILEPEVSLVVRDTNGQAIIPASTLKGALSAATEPASRSSLFGAPADETLKNTNEPKVEDDGSPASAIARLWFYPLTQLGREQGDVAGLSKKNTHQGSAFIKTSVAIDRQTGAAAAKKLFNKEHVASGQKFKGTLLYHLHGQEDDETLKSVLGQCLAPLLRPEGLAIGAGSREGHGRVKLYELSVERLTIDPQDLRLVANPDHSLARKIRTEANELSDQHPTRSRRRIWRIVCDGPFISMRTSAKENEDEAKQTLPLSITDDNDTQTPWLWPSSLLGVLRSRAAFLAECEQLRGNSRFAAQRVDAHCMDDPDYVLDAKTQISALSSVERLFGVSGLKGAISIQSMKPLASRHPRPCLFTSVTIDRFTGGAFDQRLFTEKTFVGSGFEITLEFNDRHLQDRDRELFDLLENEIGDHGLELGHGASKGFGWFDVEVVT